MDFPIKNGDFPLLFVCSPEGRAFARPFSDPKNSGAISPARRANGSTVRTGGITQGGQQFEPGRLVEIHNMLYPRGSMVLEHLPTLTPKVFKNNPNVGKYSSTMDP